MKVVDEDSALWSDRGRVFATSTARREQFSVKVTEEACRRFRRIAEERGVTLGVLFEHALDALERESCACPTLLASVKSPE